MNAFRPRIMRGDQTEIGNEKHQINQFQKLTLSFAINIFCIWADFFYHFWILSWEVGILASIVGLQLQRICRSIFFTLAPMLIETEEHCVEISRVAHISYTLQTKRGFTVRQLCLVSLPIPKHSQKNRPKTFPDLNYFRLCESVTFQSRKSFSKWLFRWYVIMQIVYTAIFTFSLENRSELCPRCELVKYFTSQTDVRPRNFINNSTKQHTHICYFVTYELCIIVFHVSSTYIAWVLSCIF